MNITCKRCGYRHPANISCEEAERRAEEARARARQIAEQAKHDPTPGDPPDFEMSIARLICNLLEGGLRQIYDGKFGVCFAGSTKVGIVTENTQYVITVKEDK